MLSDKLKQVALESKQLYQEKYPAALEEDNCGIPQVYPADR